VTAGPAGLLVGFDLDLTLVDSAAGIAATMIAALAEAGVVVTPEQVYRYAGLPLETTVARLAPRADVEAVSERYRALYPRLGVPPTVPLPGARDALLAVHRLGGRVAVVSAKREPAVRAVLVHTRLDRPPAGPDLVAGGRFADAKGEWLLAHGASVYVGDHPGDVRAAHVAGAVAVAVATGPFDAGRLRAAGADVVLGDLAKFPDWMSGWMHNRTGGVE
jgi:phosphoglycolate phosphatase